ncbi:MAG: glycine--tRNA ligase subunit beta [candidate division WOR-3 bacterium]
MPDLLLEIGTEELPSGFIKMGFSQIRERIESLLSENRIGFQGAKEFGTPRRLSVLFSGVEEKGETAEEEVLGPPVKVAFDENGNPTRAALGFAEKLGVDPSLLIRVKTEKGEYIAALVKRGGAETKTLLANAIPGIIKGLEFPKTMSWGKSLRFPRPIRWVLALWGQETLEFEMDGIRSGNTTRGHRLLSPGPIEIADPRDYEPFLKKAFVIPSWEERKALVLKRVKESAGEFGEPIEDPDLAEEVTGLVEWPDAVVGRFPEEYLVLPDEIIIQAMKAHQRYFAVMGRDGKLAPIFVAVINNISDKEDLIIPGLEGVLVARLEDAAFYFREDTKRPLASYKDELMRMKWGPWTVQEKTERVRALATKIAQGLGADEEIVSRAAELYLCDLATSMIRDGKEFTELEGVVGFYYALRSGESNEVALAIRDSRLPRFSGDAIPETKEGLALSLADKLDTLLGALSVGYEPSPTKDPLGIRRTIYAIIELILEGRLHLDATELLAWADEPFGGKEIEKARALLFSRLENYLEEKEGIRYDMVDSAIGSGSSDIYDIAERARALWNAYTRDEETFRAIAVGQKRVHKILEGIGGLPEPSPGLFEKPEEQELFRAVGEIAGPLSNALANRDYPEAISILVALKPRIDAFFDNVFVMVNDEKIRRNRLALLTEVRRLFLSYGDLSRIVVEGS